MILFLLHRTAPFHSAPFNSNFQRARVKQKQFMFSVAFIIYKLLTMYIFSAWNDQTTGNMHWLPSYAFKVEDFSCKLFSIWLGLVQMVPDATTLAKIHRESGLIGPLKENTIKKWFHHHHPLESSYQEVTSQWSLLHISHYAVGKQKNQIAASSKNEWLRHETNKSHAEKPENPLKHHSLRKYCFLSGAWYYAFYKNVSKRCFEI